MTVQNFDTRAWMRHFNVKDTDMKLVNLGLLCLVILFLPGHAVAQSLSSDDVRPAVVQLKGGSGICVSSDGWIVTAAHMLPGWPFDNQPGPQAPKRRLFQASPPPVQHPARPQPPATVLVRFSRGPEVPARVLVVRDRDQKSDIAILKVEGENLPFRPMAGRAPAVGDSIYAAGYPGDNWAWYEGRVTRIGEVETINNGVPEHLDSIDSNHACAPGASGGPLFNTRLEVIGVCARGARLPVQMTQFARWEHITACLSEAGYSPLAGAISRENGKLVLQVWTGKKCIPCLKFKADLAAGFDCNGLPLQQAFNLEFYDVDENQALAQRTGVQVVPSFVTGDGEIIAGYETPTQLARQLCRYQFPKLQNPGPPLPPIPPAFAGGVPGLPPPGAIEVRPVPGQSGPEPPPPGASAGAEEKPDEPPIDLTLIRLVVLVQKQGDTSWGLKALAKKIILSKSESAVEKRLPGLVRDKLGEKIDVDICFQRKHPQRFDELVEAAGAPEATFTILVLVHRRFEGVTGKAVEFVEKKIKDFGAVGTATAKVLFVFERTDSDLYTSVVTALDHDEDDSNETLGGAAVAGTAVGGITGISGWFSRRRRRLLPVNS
jgi:hypothetical protein